MRLVRLSQPFKEVKAPIAVVVANCFQDLLEKILKQSYAAFRPLAFYPANCTRLYKCPGISFQLNIDEVECPLGLVETEML